MLWYVSSLSLSGLILMVCFCSMKRGRKALETVEANKVQDKKDQSSNESRHRVRVVAYIRS